jgi:dipeptidyl aminopeptidase/acylaminoacyl peptidase
MHKVRLLTILVLLPLLHGLAAAAPPPLIARDVLFGNPERAAPQLSPDGKRLAWLAPDPKNVLQVWVKTIGANDDKMITADKKRGIRDYFWAEDNHTILYTQDLDGDENWHIYGVDLSAGTVRDLTPFQGVRASVLDTNWRFPNTILVNMNVRDKTVFDVYRCDLTTGALVLDTKNPGDVDDWTVDGNMLVRGATVKLPDGATEVRARDSLKAPWRTLAKGSWEEELAIDGFTPDGKGLYLHSSLGRDTAALVELPIAAGGKAKVLAERDGFDIAQTLVHPRKHNVQAASFFKGRLEWQVLDPSIKPDFDALAKVQDADFFVTSRDREDKTWLVGYRQDRGPLHYYSYDRKSQKASLLLSQQPKLDGLPLAEMKPYTVAARDGLQLPVYVTLPVGVEPKALPTVLLVHGGPWGRDLWGYSPTVQWLANRGYAVLQVNFRGSTGYGKKFLHAGDKQWGKAMHTDLLDAVKWAVAQGWADPKRVAIMGGSYGGYATLAAAAFTPDAFKCGVDIVGPSNLFTLLKAVPPYWKLLRLTLVQRMGDPDKDQELLQAASPLFSASRIRMPLLIGQGANDPRVNQAESEQIVAALEKNGQQAVYVLYSDEGHGFARPENRIDFNARAEKFLGEQLGGRVEPLPGGGKVAGSTAVVRQIAAKTR